MMASESPIETPVFSPRLDEVLGMMINGEAPNLGRFCGYCYTPMGKTAATCPYCQRPVAEIEPLSKVPPEIIGLYRRWRKRESLVVNSFAFAGLFLGVVIFTVLVAVAVYLMDASLWMLGFATVVLLVGGRVFAGLLGGWIGDDIGYRYARRKLVEEWAEYEQARKTGGSAAPSTATSSAP